MTDDQLRTLKRRLEQEKSVLLQRRKNAGTYEPTDQEMSQHPADNAMDLTEQTMELTLDGERDYELRLVEAALQRIEQGTYGICVVGGEQIPYKRLEVLPTADTCVEHAE